MLERTLASVSAQADTGDLAVEVIVVDNNSSDNTAAVVAAAAADWKPGRLHYVFEARQGKQFALNSGIATSTMDILAFTDDDIIVDARWIASIAQAFSRADVDLAGGKTLVVWPRGGPPPWFHPSMSAIVGGFDMGEGRIAPAPAGFAPAGANLVARRDLFERVGRFSEAHFRHMDYEFGMRCRRAGARLAYEPALVVHAPVDEIILNRRYFRRWSFKAGIAREDADEGAAAGKWLGVPRWLFRQFLEDVGYLAFRAPFAPAPEAFARQLRAWRAAGTIGSRWYAWWRPERHEQWVAKYSQKKKDVY